MKNVYADIYGWFDFDNVYNKVVMDFHDNSIFVEVGCWLGKSTAYLVEKILDSGKFIKLYAVDTWEGSNEDVHREYIGKIGGSDKLYEKFIENMNKISNVNSVLIPIRKQSVLAANDFADKSVSFCFIDAGHTYEGVIADIKAWLPKIKNGGILAGHDYNENNPAAEGLCRAVKEVFGNSFRVSRNSWIKEL